MKDPRDFIRQSYGDHGQEIESIVRKIHAAPELSEAEHLACGLQVDFLESQGFLVEKNFKGLETAYCARFGRGRPGVCIMSEYDALPGIGHGCGHNLITGVALGTGMVLRDLMVKNELQGQVIVMGTPAEEKRGCKVDLIRAGALEGVDVVLMAHPSDHPTSQSMEEAGIMQFSVDFKGRSAHAAAAPERGINALDAVRLMFSGVDAWRQQLPETSRIHGIIKQGGEAPNIIPDHTRADFYLRSFDMAVLLSMATRFENIAKGAALMTDTRVRVEEIPNSYKPAKPNNALNKAFMALAEAYGMNPEWQEPSRASSDFGDVTYEVPAMHAFFNITGDQEKILVHSREFTQCAASDFALEQMGKTAQILAQIGYRYFTREEFRKKVLADFPFTKTPKSTT